MTKRHITFILNPAAGRGKAQHILASLRSALAHSTLDYEFHLTNGRGHATTLARDASTRSSIVVAVGGDGTVNEVASGLVGTDAALAVMSEGSGNDFARLVSAPKEPRALISLLQDPHIKSFDAGSAVVTHADGTSETRSFFNSVGIGFDAAVAKRVSAIRYLRGIPLYLTALLQTIAGYQPHRLSVRTGGKEWMKDYFLLCIGNGRWEGGGFMLTPDAQPDDGKFQVCCVSGPSMIKVLPVLPSVMTGTHIGKRYIEVFDATEIGVSSDSVFPVHGDGEIFGWDVIKTEISIQNGALKVVVPHTR
jgi:YegS/Rv2252/BmrU family lipid kinase